MSLSFECVTFLLEHFFGSKILVTFTFLVTYAHPVKTVTNRLETLTLVHL